MSFPTYEEVLALKSDTTIKNIWVYLSEKHQEDKERLRRWFRTETEKRAKEGEEILKDEFSDESEEQKFRVGESTSFDEKGNIKYISSNRVILMHEEDSKSPEYVLKAHGFDPSLWILVTVLNNYWQGMRTKDRGSATLYQSKVTVKPKLAIEEVTIKDIDNFFRTFNSENISKPELRKNSYGKSKLLINLADAHFGNDADGFSTRLSVLKLIETIKQKSKGFDISEIIFVNFGDLLHVDNYAGQTTAGTQVGGRGKYYGIWNDAVETLILAIDELKSIAPVKYISVCGNHDKISSYTVGKTLEYYYKNNKNVKMDCDFEEQKIEVIGNSVFLLIHGDVPAKNVSTVLQRDHRKEYGESKYSYVLLGHIHHANIIDKDGVIISHLPSITPPDEWHKGQLYTGTWKGTYCYIVDEEEGISDTWHIPA